METCNIILQVLLIALYYLLIALAPVIVALFCGDLLGRLKSTRRGFWLLSNSLLLSMIILLFALVDDLVARRSLRTDPNALYSIVLTGAGVAIAIYVATVLVVAIGRHSDATRERMFFGPNIGRLQNWVPTIHGRWVLIIGLTIAFVYAVQMSLQEVASRGNTWFPGGIFRISLHSWCALWIGDALHRQDRLVLECALLLGTPVVIVLLFAQPMVIIE